MRHLLLALMGLLLLSVDVSAQESTLPGQIETVLRSRHRHRHHSSSSANVIVGPTGPMGLPGVPGATGATGPAGSLVNAYASVFSDDEQTFIETGTLPLSSPFPVTFKDETIRPVGIFYPTPMTPFTILTLQNDGVYLITWNMFLTVDSPPQFTGTALIVNGNLIDKTLDSEEVDGNTYFSGQTIMRLKAGDQLQLAAITVPSFAPETIHVFRRSLVITQIAQ